MLGFFSNKNKLKQADDKNSLIRYEKDEQGVISIFFNELKANKIKGEYQYDSKGSFEKIGKPKDSNEKFKKYTIFEWAIENQDFVESGDTLFIIKRNEDDYIKDVMNEVLILPQIVNSEKGIVEIIKHEKDEIVNNDLICKIYPDDIFTNSNNPQNEIYFGKYDKYEIPKRIRDLNQITGKFIFLTKRLVNNGDGVTKGDDIIEVKGGNSETLFFTYTLKAKASGIIEFVKSETTLYVTDELEQKEILYIVFKDEDIRFNYKYSNEYLIVQDDFNGIKIIKWDVVGGFKYPYNSTSQNPIGGIISNSEDGKDLIFSFQNHDGRDYITIIFFTDEYKLSKGDKVYFMFDNNEVIDFEIIEKPYKSSYNWKKLFETKILITENDLLKFKDSVLLKWKIDLISQNEQIIGNGGNDWYNGENYYKVIQKLATEYIELVEKEVENYTPLTEKPKIDSPSGKDNEECYVYLMIDTTNSFHKIGISNLPEYREKTLQSEKPTIELICAKEFPSRKIAESIEKALHETFSDKRLRGEWFELSESEINEIKQTLK